MSRYRIIQKQNEQGTFIKLGTNLITTKASCPFLQSFSNVTILSYKKKLTMLFTFTIQVTEKKTIYLTNVLNIQWLQGKKRKNCNSYFTTENKYDICCP